MIRGHREPNRAGDYRRHAHECITAAVTAANEEARVALLELAFSWARLAKQVENLDPNRRGPAGDDLQGVEVVVITSKRPH